MIWFIGLIVLGLNYLVEWLRFAIAKLTDPSRPAWVPGPGPWLAHRYKHVAAWEDLSMGMWRSSPNPQVERRRRATWVSFVAVVVWMFGGLAVGISLDRVLGHEAALPPALEPFAIIGTAVVVLSGCRLAIGAWDPEPPVGRRWPLVGMAVGLSLLVLPVVAVLRPT